jgi:hypothetical protein
MMATGDEDDAAAVRAVHHLGAATTLLAGTVPTLAATLT